MCSQQEWTTARDFFRRPLPVAFRVNQASNEGSTQSGLVSKLEALVNQDDMLGLLPSPYFSDSLTRVAKVPPREWTDQAQQLMSDAQDLGVLHRQELVSMIPPLLLNVTNDCLHILDLCAAPGSKSLQILDQIQCLPKSMLVCNDANRDRLMVVARRSKVHNTANLILSSSDGRHFPTLRRGGSYKLKFDRVLADVPCSGDGTLRKLSSTEWKQWSTKSHLALHKLQLKLLCRALEIVKKGGRVLYSTCSLDPIENEAVVVSAIARMGGPSLYRVLPPPKHLGSPHDDRVASGFPYCPGVTSWKVPDPKFCVDQPTMYDCIDSVPKEHQERTIYPSMFPPSTRSVKAYERDNHSWSIEERQKKLETAKFYGDIMPQEDIDAFEAMLPNCCRILPQHLDSGGFFCAIIERVEPKYFAAFHPSQRELDEPISPHHGSIYTGVQSTRALKDILLQEQSMHGEEMYLEGHPTLEAAQSWLRKHNSFIEGRSNQVVLLSDIMVSIEESSLEQESTTFRRETVLPLQKPKWIARSPPLFTPMFQSPNPDLVHEFCEFYGLHSNEDGARKAGVARFPGENLVLMGRAGGSDEEESSVLSTIQSWKHLHEVDHEENDSHSRPATQYTQLSLVSEEVRRLYKGGAKFSPLQVGTALCSIPISSERGSQRKKKERRDSIRKKRSPIEEELRMSIPYALNDEAVNLVGRCATKRVVELSVEQSKQLLQDRVLLLEEASGWDSGGVVARLKDNDDDVSTTCVACALVASKKGGGEKVDAKLHLLTKDRLRSALLRRLRS